MTLLLLFVLAQGLWRGFAATDVSHEDSPCPSGWILAPQGLGCVLLQVATKVPHAWYLANSFQMCLNLADRSTDLGGRLRKLLEKPPSTFGWDQEWGAERFSQVTNKIFGTPDEFISSILSFGKKAWFRNALNFAEKAILRKNVSSTKMRSYPNASIFHYNRTLVSEFPDDTVYGWWIGATDLNRCCLVFFVLTVFVVENQFQSNLIWNLFLDS